MRRWLHQWLGLSLTGDVSEQILAFLYGKGGNGKSVLIDAVSYVAGDYGETVPIETFLDHGKARSAGQATPDLAILPGVRMLRTSEPEKELETRRGDGQARHRRRADPGAAPQPRFLQVLSAVQADDLRQLPADDLGRRRRHLAPAALVPFDVTIPKEERDIHLAEKLRAEASGILNRLLDGLRLWCDKRLIEPEDVAKATAEYRSDSDAFGRFAATCLEAKARRSGAVERAVCGL
jgi:putative DNA primase/helicase